MTSIQGSTICPDPEQLKQFNYPLAVTGLKLQLANMLVLDIISLHRESTRPLLHSLAKGKPRCLSWHTISRKERGGAVHEWDGCNRNHTGLVYSRPSFTSI